MASKLVEVSYPRDDIGKEGSVISKSQGTRHFQKLNPGLIVVSVSKFKMNWETMEIECAFMTKEKFADGSVSKEKFLELMQTNSNLLRDLEEANARIEELEAPRISQCTEEEVRVCYAKYYELKDDYNPDDYPEPTDAIVKHDPEFAKTQEDLEATKKADVEKFDKAVDGFIAGSKLEKGIAEKAKDGEAIKIDGEAFTVRDEEVDGYDPDVDDTPDEKATRRNRDGECGSCEDSECSGRFLKTRQHEATKKTVMPIHLTEEETEETSDGE